MEFKGTKENWELITGYDEKYNQPILDVGSGGNASICTIWSGVDKGDELPHEVKADALLISKAPEMLDMLIRLVDRMEENDLGSQHSVKRAKQLIKEATEIN